jgi:hypothetical protein
MVNQSLSVVPFSARKILSTRKFIHVQMKRESMKSWQITGFFSILILGLLLMSGCTNTTPTGVATPTPTVTIPPATVSETPTLTVKVTPVPTVPAEGVYVHVKYLGGWKGTYGMSTALQAVTSSGERYYPVVNATGTVQASFTKLDDSVKQTLVIEILNNGRILTTGNTSAANGDVRISANV